MTNVKFCKTAFLEATKKMKQIEEGSRKKDIVRLEKKVIDWFYNETRILINYAKQNRLFKPYGLLIDNQWGGLSDTDILTIVDNTVRKLAEETGLSPITVEKRRPKELNENYLGKVILDLERKPPTIRSIAYKEKEEQ